MLRSRRLQVRHVIGIDAGGIKTVCLLAGDDGHVLAQARASGANLQAVGELEVEKVLHAVMSDAVGDRGIWPQAICLGVAGVDREGDSAIVRAIMRRIGYNARIIRRQRRPDCARGRRGDRARHRLDRRHELHRLRAERARPGGTRRRVGLRPR
jgi:hypothetical protein